MKKKEEHTTVSIGTPASMRSVRMVVRFAFESRLCVLKRTLHLIEDERHGGQSISETRASMDSR